MDQLEKAAPARVWAKGGDRPVLALHCSLAHSGAWAGLAEALNGVTTTAIDLPGHGRAPDWDGASDIHGLATELAAAWAERLGQGQPIDLMGHSFGGTVALRLAIERPDLVRSLTLFEPVYFVAAKLAGDPTYPPFDISHALIAERIAEGKSRLAVEEFLVDWGGGERFEDLPERMQAYILQRIPLVVAQNPVLLDDSPQLLAPGRLEGLRCPILMVEGSNSPPIISAIYRALAPRLPQLRRHVEPGAGHMVMITHAQPLAPGVQAHLEAC